MKKFWTLILSIALALSFSLIVSCQKPASTTGDVKQKATSTPSAVKEKPTSTPSR